MWKTLGKWTLRLLGGLAVLALLDVVGRPEGRIHFAGEHTSRLSTSMDGALESGMRAAREIDEAGTSGGG